MGYSGSGKSSLMYCGVIPMLYGGFMTESGPYWEVVTIRPGSTPIDNLANTLVNMLLAQGRIEEKDRQIHRAIFNSVLRSGPEGLVEVSKFIQSKPDENVFLLVDQFEELFRLSAGPQLLDRIEAARRREEAASFVQLLLAATRSYDSRIRVVITMRSDFIGDCARFRDLPG